MSKIDKEVEEALQKCKQSALAIGSLTLAMPQLSEEQLRKLADSCHEGEKLLRKWGSVLENESDRRVKKRVNAESGSEGGGK